MTFQWGWGFSVITSLFVLNVGARIYLLYIYVGLFWGAWLPFVFLGVVAQNEPQ